MPSITLKYDTSSRTFSKALSVKGFLPTDGMQFAEFSEYERLDGSLARRLLGFYRIFRINLGIITDPDELLFLGRYLTSNNQYIGSFTYAGTLGGSVTETDVGVVDNHADFTSAWEGGVEVGRQIFLELKEKSYRTDWPTNLGYGFSYGYDYGDHF